MQPKELKEDTVLERYKINRPTSVGPMMRKLLAVVAAFGLITFGLLLIGSIDVAWSQTVRQYNLEIVPVDIEMGPGVVWHAWTFNGAVPGPTLIATVGETLRVRVTNRHNLTHSFHTHLTNYDLKYDGSQSNTITGIGAGAMIPPGSQYTYEFQPTEPGIYYYHCHSADGGFMISEHIHQGLYGAIIVKAPEDPPIRDEVIFMSEPGHDIMVSEGGETPLYIMNGMGIPGGEHGLEKIFKEKGLAGVVEQFNKTLPAIKVKVGEPFRLHVINIGDQMHTFHAHHFKHVSQSALQGRIWPANLLPLLPGAADTLIMAATKPGVWLFHCHVVNHADQGMIGVFIVEE